MGEIQKNNKKHAFGQTGQHEEGQEAEEEDAGMS